MYATAQTPLQIQNLFYEIMIDRDQHIPILVPPNLLLLKM